MISTPAKRTHKERTSVILSLVTIVLLLICLLAPASAAASADAAAQGPGPMFVENVGQFAPQAHFLLTTSQGRVWVADDGLWLVTAQRAPLSPDEMKLPVLQRERALRTHKLEGAAVRLSFAGARFAGKIEPFGALDTQVSFLHGSDPNGWQTNVPAWSGVRVKDLYPGVDLVVGGDATGRVPWRIEAQAGAAVSRVRLQVAGASDVSLADGRLQLQTNIGTLGVNLPALHGAKAGAQPTVAAAAEGEFEVAAPFAAAAAPDAATDLLWATFLGGAGLDTAHNIALDASGNSYVIGETQALDFPTTTGVLDVTGDGSEAFVAKINAAGSARVYATYLGGSGLDYGFGIAVDGNGVAYVTGDTDSLDFPGAGATTPAGQNDMYVAALNANGTAATFVKFFGGTGPDYGYDVALDGTNVYTIGSTYSSDFAATVTSGPGGGVSDVMVVKLSSAGVTSYAAKAGGADQDEGYALKVRSGEVYGAGETRSLNFPGGAAIAGGSDALIFKLTTAGAVATSYALGDTLLATPADDFAQDLALDAAGVVYVTGGTASASFPVTSGTPAFGGGLRDAFASKLSLSGTTWTLQFSVLIGGSGLEDGYGIGVDSAGGMFVSGETESTNFPTTANAYDASQNGATDAFLVRTHPAATTANRVTYGTYLGGSGYEGAYALALDATGNTYLAGQTDSTNFPVTTGAYDTTVDATASDAFVAKLHVPSIPAAPVLSIARSVNDGALSWTAVTIDNFGAPMTVSGYRLWHSLSPYFQPGDTTSPTAIYNGANRNYTDAGVCLSLDNYYYVVNAVGPNGELSVNSNRVGEFTFGLVKGQ